MIRELTANEGRTAETEYLMEYMYVSAQACCRALTLIAAATVR
jgi:hypothetical protein